jgi:hypothetical protein
MTDFLSRAATIVGLSMLLGLGVGWWWSVQHSGQRIVRSEITVTPEQSRPVRTLWNIPTDGERHTVDLPTAVAERAMQWLRDHPEASDVFDRPDGLQIAAACKVEIEPRGDKEAWRLIWTADDADESLAEVLTRSLAETLLGESSSELAFQRQQLQQTIAREETALKELEALAAEHGLSDEEHVAAVEAISAWSAAIAVERRDRIAAENRLAQSQAELKSGMPIELVASRLPEGPIQEAVIALIQRDSSARRLASLADERKRLAEVYGRRHPRMRELDAEVAKLTETAKTDAPTISPEDLLVRTLAAEIEEHRGIEQDLEQQLKAERERVDQSSELRDKLAAAKASLAEHRRRADELPDSAAILRALPDAVTSPPRLEEQADWVTQPMLYWMSIGGGSGVVVGIVALLMMSQRRYDLRAGRQPIETRPIRTSPHVEAYAVHAPSPAAAAAYVNPLPSPPASISASGSRSPAYSSHDAAHRSESRDPVADQLRQRMQSAVGAG